jgi:hypothetical protein
MRDLVAGQRLGFKDRRLHRLKGVLDIPGHSELIVAQFARGAGSFASLQLGPWDTGCVSLRWITLAYDGLPGECWIPVPLPPPAPPLGQHSPLR